MLRRVLGIFLLMLCLAAFWFRFETRFAEIEADTFLRDDIGALSAAELARLQTLRTVFRDTLGVSVRIRLGETLRGELPLNAAALLLDVAPSQGVQAILPPLVARAVPVAPLESSLAACLQRLSPGSCIQNTLIDVLAALDVKPEAVPDGMVKQDAAPSSVRGVLNRDPKRNEQ